MSEFHLTIRTPEKDVFEGRVRALTFNAEDGRIQILAHHANIVTTLQYSFVRVDKENKSETFLARNGMFTFDHKKNVGLLLCMFCEEQSEVSFQSAKEYLEFLRTELAKGDLSEYQVLYLEGERLAVEKQVKALRE